MSTQEQYVIHTDGGSRGNPGPAAYAYTIERFDIPTIEVKTYLGQSTNNIAEYTGLVKALEHARDLQAHQLLIYSDSELMVKQMNGEYKVKNEALRELYLQANQLRKCFEKVTIRHVYREQNQEADRLCNEALDNPRSAPPRNSSPQAPKPALQTNTPAPNPFPQFTGKITVTPLTTLRRKAIAYLEDCAAQWADADPKSPQVAEVWDQLWKMLQEAKVLREDLVDKR